MLVVLPAVFHPLLPPPPLAGAIEQLRRIAELYVTLADSQLPAHAHLEAADRDTMRKEAGAALEWLNEKVALQAQVRAQAGCGAGAAGSHDCRPMWLATCSSAHHCVCI
jgi:hypothetical protein